MADASGHVLRAHVAYAQRCADPYPASRDRSNPLMLRTAPGSDPLNGAKLFVDGPARGVAAGAIETLLGLSPQSFPNDATWAQFRNELDHGRLHARLASDPGLRYRVAELEKIAGEPEEARFSPYSGGGGPGAVFSQVQRFVCDTLQADPGAVPVITTYFLHQNGGCESTQQILAYRPRFERQVDEFANGIANRPAVILLELDAIGSSQCMQSTGALPYWEGDIRYEIAKVSALPHAVVYIEGGYSDAEGPSYTARVLKAVGVRRIRGFFTNDTHFEWTINEIHWGEAVSKLTGGAHFVVNTGENGRGPLLNADPVTQGVEDLCNPPARGLGPRPTAPHRVRPRRCVPVDRRAGQQRRQLRRRPAARGLLAGAGDQARASRAGQARSGLRRRRLLTRTPGHSEHLARDRGRSVRTRELRGCP